MHLKSSTEDSMNAIVHFSRPWFTSILQFWNISVSQDLLQIWRDANLTTTLYWCNSYKFSLLTHLCFPGKIKSLGKTGEANLGPNFKTYLDSHLATKTKVLIDIIIITKSSIYWNKEWDPGLLGKNTNLSVWNNYI